MKIKYLKFKSWLYASLAAVMGINMSCDYMVEEYGTPWARYQVKGTVTNEQGAPVEGILVSLDWEKTLTDNKGDYEVASGYPGDNGELELSFKDIDSTENGLYADTSLRVSFRDVPLQGGDGNWFEGAATVKQDVTLRKKE